MYPPLPSDDAPSGEDETTDPGIKRARPWTVLSVDDEDAVHAVTRLALQGVAVDGRPIRLLSARSGHEARVVLVSNPDIAVVLLDVALADGTVGLDLARWIRKDLGNGAIRIVIRTGEPGMVSEHEVIHHHDINDFREKSSLTAQGLRTLVAGSIRNWRDIRAVEAHRAGLARVVEAATTMLSPETSFLDVVLSRVCSLFGPGASAAVVVPEGTLTTSSAQIRMGVGRFAHVEGVAVSELLPAELVSAVGQALVFGGLATARMGVAYGFQGRAGRLAVVLDGGAQDDDMARGLFSLVGSVAALVHERGSEVDAWWDRARAYEGLVPPPLLELAGVKDARELLSGGRASTDVAVVAAGYVTPDLAQLCVVEGLVREVLEGHGGVLVQQTDTRLVVAFPDGPAVAAGAAVAAITQLERLGLRNAARCAVSMGLLTMLTLGEERPRGFLAVGAPIEEAVALLRRAGEEDVRVIVSDDVRTALRPSHAERLAELRVGRHVLWGFPGEMAAEPPAPR